MKNLITPLLIIICIIAMICSPDTAVYGASYGIILWFNNILPTLLPFMIATNIIVKLNIMKSAEELIKRIFHRNTKFPVCIIYIIFTGFLCGFPMGAKVINDFYQNNDINDSQASWLISFCNLPSPMFIISYAAMKCLQLKNIVIFAVCFYLPLLLIIPMSYYVYIKRNTKLKIQEISQDEIKSDAQNEHRLSIPMLEKSMLDSYIAIAKIGGYMVIFSIIAAFLERTVFINPLLKCIIICFFEMTTGISLVAALNINIAVKMAASAAALGFGGLSCTAQTAGVISNTNIKIKHYAAWRILHASISAALILCIAFI